jgi:hypothetical protein
MLSPLRAAPALALFLAAAAPSLAAGTLRVPQDHKTIQAAIDAAQEGDRILVAVGTYTERVRMKPGVTLKSAGDDSKGALGLKRAESTIIDGNVAGAEGAGVTMAEDSSLDGFTVTGVGQYDDALWKKHHATQGEEQSHEHIGAPGTAGIAVTGIARCTVVNNIVHHIGYTGIAITGAEGKRVSPRIVRNVAYRNMGGGIGSMKKSAAIIEENVCFENFYAGIGHSDASPLVINNVCYGNIRAGIGISEGSCPIVRGNKCYQNRRAGIGVRSEKTAPLVEDNDCYENAMAGIGSRDGASPVVRGNRCHENGMAGIGSRGGARPVIVGNKCYRNADAGIGSELGAVAYIAHNECYENEDAGIGQRSDAETTLDGNYVHHNKKAGLGFDECKSGNSTVVHNKVVDNGLVAVGIHAGWNVRLVGNELSRPDGLPPIVMVFKGSEAEFSGNTIQGSGVAGIRTEGTVRIVNNKFHCPGLRKGGGPPQFAVWGLPGAEIVFVGNKIARWRHALSADKAAVSASYNEVSDYWQVGIRVSDPTAPATAIGNIFWSEAGHTGVEIKGDQGIVEDNRVEKARPTSAAAAGEAPENRPSK